MLGGYRFDRGAALGDDLPHQLHHGVALGLGGQKPFSGHQRIGRSIFDCRDLQSAEAHFAKIAFDLRGDLETASLLGRHFDDLIRRRAFAAQTPDVVQREPRVFGVLAGRLVRLGNRFFRLVRHRS